MKMTLLEIVQKVLNAMESDNVNSISDSEESLMVASHVQDCYYELLSQRDWPFLRTQLNLVGLSDLDNPTHMELPEACSKVLWIKYNKKKVEWKDPLEFQNLLDSREELEDVVDASGFVLNRDPLYYTTFDDATLVFDGYNQADDDTLQASKAIAYGTVLPSWSETDEFVPPLPAKMFPMFLAECKSTCFLNMKQQANAKEERKAQRGRMTMQNEAWRDNGSEGKYNRRVNYGRK